MMYWQGIKYFKNIFYVSWLMNYHNMIQIITIKQKWVMKYLTLTNGTYGNKGDS